MRNANSLQHFERSLRHYKPTVRRVSKIVLSWITFNFQPNKLWKLTIWIKLSKLLRHGDFNLVESRARESSFLNFTCHPLRNDKTGRALQKLVSKPPFKLIMKLTNNYWSSLCSLDDCMLSPTASNFWFYAVKLHCPPPTVGLNLETTSRATSSEVGPKPAVRDRRYRA